MRRPLALALSAAVSAVLAVSGSAVHADATVAEPHPDHATATDKAGDAPAAIDLVSSAYSLTKQAATFTVRVKDLGESGLFAFEIWPLTDAWDRLAVSRVHGKTVAKDYFIDNSLEDTNQPVPHLRQCPGLKVDWNSQANTITVTWPASVKCRQASQPDTHPFQFHVFSRLGGAHDAMPPKTLDY